MSAAFFKIWDEALNQRPHILLEIGFTRPTGWMIHVWDAEFVGIKAAKKIITVQSEKRVDAMKQAKKLLEELIA